MSAVAIVTVAGLIGFGSIEAGAASAAPVSSAQSQARALEVKHAELAVQAEAKARALEIKHAQLAAQAKAAARALEIKHARLAAQAKANAAAAAKAAAPKAAAAKAAAAKAAAAQAAAAKAAAAQAAAAKAAAAQAAAAKAAAAQTAAAAPVPVSTVVSAAASTTPVTDVADTTDANTAVPIGNVVSNGRTWVQSYHEDFSTPAPLGQVLNVYPQMQAYNGFADTSGQGLYAPDKVLSVSNGNLDFWLHSVNNQPLVASILPDGYAPHTTGRISIRYKTTDTPGYKFVGMFWPSDNNWNEGEIDWPEADLGQTPRPADAVPGSFSNGNMSFLPATQMFASSNSSEYHVATTEWDSNAVRFYWDGQLVSTVTNAVPTTAMRVTLQAETWINEGAVPKDASGHLDIDWISIWN
jgi:hypothetical protein